VSNRLLERFPIEIRQVHVAFGIRNLGITDQIAGEIMRLETSSENTVLTFSAATASQPCGLFGVPRCHQVHCWARVVRWVVGAVCHLNILEMECSVNVRVAHSPYGVLGRLSTCDVSGRLAHLLH
jgi:hypothetical protein